MPRKTIISTFVFLFFIVFSFAASARTYYVSSAGNDGSAGTSESTAWRTLSKVNSFSFSPGDNILFRRGDTFYGSVKISRSGASGSPITYGAYGSGAKPIITGFTNVTSWSNLGGNIWESSAAVSALSTCNMVSVGGVSVAMGRYPNTGYFTFQSHSGNSTITSSSLSGSTNWKGASIAIKKQRWYIEKGTITGQSGTTLTYTDGKRYTPTDGWGFFIQNDPRTLDRQNEWYYNPSTKKLRVYSTGQPSNVKLATVENIFDNSANCKYITIDNLNITGANSNLIESNYGQYATITNCDLSFAGMNGIDINSIAPTIVGNTINNTGSSGIFSHQNGVGGVMKNNVIRNTGVIPGAPDNGGGGAIYSVASNTLIQNNIIDSSGWGGIVFYGNNSIVKNNFVNHSCLVIDDCGGIATHGGFTGQQIIGNIVLNSIGNWEGSNSTVTLLAHGIFLDDLSNAVTVSGNSVAGCAGVGYDFHRATNIDINNNTAYDNGTKGNWMKGAIIFQCKLNDPVFKGMKLNNNIFVARTTDQLAFFYSLSSGTANDIKQFGVADNNVYARPINGDDNSILVNSTYYDVKGWQSYSGQEANSKGSPKSISNLNDMRFEYNATSSSKTIGLDAKYIDMKGASYNGSITLAPFTSAVLIKNGAATNDNLLPAVNPTGTVNGLDYDYYEADSYSSLPTFSSLTPVKTGTADNFDISKANRSTSYSFNFTGYINVPADGQYTFYTTSDDGSSLSIDNVLVVDNDGLHGATEKSGTIGLKAGKHAISVGYFQQSNGATLSVSYAGPGTSKQVIPASALYRVSSASSLLPAVNPSGTVSGLDYNYYEAMNYDLLPSFGSLTPVKTGNTDNFDISMADRGTSFSFNFMGYINVPADGQYTFYTTSDDGSNLYIDNQLVVDNDGLHGATEKSGVIGLKAGKHAISVGYFQQGGGSTLSVSYAGPGVSKQTIPSSALYRVSNGTGLLSAVNPSNTVNGLDYDYFEAGSYNVLPDFSSLTPTTSGTTNGFDISPARRSTSYSFSFTGYINVPSDGQYTFYTKSDDGSDLYIDNVKVVDNDGIHGMTENSGVIGLKAGKHAISVGFFQQAGGAGLTVSYAGPGISKQTVPASALYRVSGLNLLPAVNPSNTVNGLDYDYFEAGSYSVLPDFSSLTPTTTGTTNGFDISPARRSTSYSFNFTGYINVPSDGQYTFYTQSDDGSRLYIDNQLVVDNDGIHGLIENSGVIGLKAGKHAISVGFFQQAGGSSLSVSYAGPGISKQVIPSSALYRVSGIKLLSAVNPSGTVNGLNYAYYEAGSYSALPDFGSLTPIKTGTTNGFDISPARRSTAFSFNFTGYINVPSDGQYTFYAQSDDGSNLYIDNVPVVSNDGIHGLIEKSGVIGLKAGKHAISVGYFQQSGGSTLSVSYAGPGVAKQVIPASALYRISGSSSQRIGVSTNNTRATGTDSLSASATQLMTDSPADLMDNSQTQQGIRVYPNPFKHSININIERLSGNESQLLLFDAAGKVLWKEQIDGSVRSYHKVLNTSSFANGIYFLRLLQGNETKVIKLIKQP